MAHTRCAYLFPLGLLLIFASLFVVNGVFMVDSDVDFRIKGLHLMLKGIMGIVGMEYIGPGPVYNFNRELLNKLMIKHSSTDINDLKNNKELFDSVVAFDFDVPALYDVNNLPEDMGINSERIVWDEEFISGQGDDILKYQSKIENRLFIPKNAWRENGDSSEGVPLLIYFHGGGMVLGSAKQADYDLYSRKIAETNGIFVLNVEYRLAPEYKFPFSIEDSYSSLYWIVHNKDLCETEEFSELCAIRELLPIDLSRVILGGDSAGGNISFETNLLWRDRRLGYEIDEMDLHDKFKEKINKVHYHHHFHNNGITESDPVGLDIKLLLLIYPGLYKYPRTVSASKDHYIITTKLKKFFGRAYLFSDDDQENDDEQDDNSLYINSFKYKYISPFYVSDFSGFNHIHLITCEHDPLIDENLMFVKFLKENNVNVSHSHYEDTTHGFATFMFLPESKVAFAECSNLINKFI